MGRAFTIIMKFTNIPLIKKYSNKQQQSIWIDQCKNDERWKAKIIKQNYWVNES